MGAVCEQRLEGVVAKRLDERYRPAERRWVKQKNPGWARYEREGEAAIESALRRRARMKPHAIVDVVFASLGSRRGRFSVSATEEPTSFERHIRPLFRQGDREAMTWAFDLWSHSDVARNGDAILERLRDGSMPCDRAWPDAQIVLFQDWVEAGAPG